MSVTPGTRLGPYVITAQIGKGGMGEVYRATDTNLGRQIAIKVLPETFAHDTDRLARFEREARTLASLNHPNIAAIYGLEAGPFEAGSHVRALVLELVDGPTLADRVAQGPMPVDDAIAIARQMADALESAHELGIVHRDLKPSNIKVRDDGAVKVLDFGLAKLHDPYGPNVPNASMSPTLTSPAMTGVGAIIGTAAYMAPEQAKGKAVDKRADIWAFGAVLYEMLTGRALFEGETVSEVLAAVIMREPDLSALPSGVPAHIRHLVARCLVKDPKLRLRDIGEARLALAGPGSAPGARTGLDTPAAPAVRASAGRWPLAVSGVLAVALAASVVAWWRATTAAPLERVTRYEVRPPEAATLALDSRPVVTVSPDGSTLVYVARNGGVTRLYIRGRGDLAARALPGTEGATHPVFSPDGTRIAFFSDAMLKQTSVDGVVLDIIHAGGDTDAPRRGLDWLTEDSLVYSPLGASPLFSVASTGGTPMPLTTLDESRGERTHRWPSVLPGGKAVLFTVGTVASPDNYDRSTIEVVDVATGRRQVVLKEASSARYVRTGHLLFARAAAVYAVPFDVERLTTTGTPVPVLQGVNGDSTTGALHLSVSADGTAAYVPGSGRAGSSRLMWVDRAGQAQALPLPEGIYYDPRLSPDGTRVAVSWQAATAGSPDIWVSDLARGTFTRLSVSGTAFAPVWSADGRSIYFSYIDPTGRKTTIMRRPADGSREAEPVVVLDTRAYVQVIDPEERWALVDSSPPGAAGDIVKIALTAGAQPERLVATRFDELESTLSPDGRWLAYVSDETGRFEVYVRDMSGASGRWQLSTGGGEEPHWSGDGRELFYRNESELMSVAIGSPRTLDPGAPAMVFDGVHDLRSDSGISYAVDPKGRRFLMIRLSEENATSSIVVVLDWFQELRRLMTAE